MIRINCFSSRPTCIEPFLVVPVPALESDMTIVMGPQDPDISSAIKQSTSICYQEYGSELAIDQILAQISKDKGGVIAALSYRTNAPEIRSNRTGQLLTAGIYVDTKILYYHNPVFRPAFEILLKRLANIIREPMDARGASTLLQIIQSLELKKAQAMIRGNPDIVELFHERFPLMYRERPSLCDRTRMGFATLGFLAHRHAMMTRSIDKACNYWNYVDKRICVAKRTWHPE
jgi:hypothetical protein